MIRSPVRTAVAATLAFLVSGCAESPVATPSGPDLSESPVGTLIECPTDETLSASGLIGVLGGVVRVGGHSVTIPVGALLSPTTIRVTVPASNHLEVRLQADDHAHFEFLQPVVVSISYGRCGDEAVEGKRLGIWYVDAQDNLLEYHGGVQDPLTRSVTAITDHFSDYAVGAN